MNSNSLPTHFGKYEVTGQLGSGGMATVYAAHDQLLDRRVAIKVIHPHLASEPGFADRFRQEARLVAGLRHPHIVRLYDFQILDEQPLMVMEFLDGDTLKELLSERHRQGQRLDLSTTARILQQLASALNYAHELGAVHRDIKPANILFTGGREPVITDFGIAKLLNESMQLSLTGGVIGTPAYMSPEQAAGKPVDSRSDQYSLAVMVFEMVTGRVPFIAESATGILMHHLQSPPPDPRKFNPNLPLPVQQVILRGLAKRPDERFESVLAFSRAFDSALLGQAPQVLQATALGEFALQETITDEATSPPAGAGAQPGAANTPTEAPVMEAPAAEAAGVETPGVETVQPKKHQRELALPWRRWAGIGLGVVALLAVLLFFGFGGPQLFQSAPAPAVTADYRIAVADFDGSAASITADFGRRIYDELSTQLQSLEERIAVQRIDQVLASSQEAQAAGQQRGDDLVIWGWYDDLGVSSHIELVDAPQQAPQPQRGAVFVDSAQAAPLEGGAAQAIDLQDFFNYLRVPRLVSEFELFTASGPQQLAFLSETLLGMAYQSQGELDQALALFDQAVDNATSAEIPAGIDLVYFQRALGRLQQGRTGEAIADLERAVAANPELVEGFYNLAVLYPEHCLPARQLDQAVQAAESAAALAPEDAGLQQLLASIYAQAGQMQQALAAANQAVALDPDQPEGQLLLGDLYQAAGEDEQAQRAWQQAAEIYEQASLDEPAQLVALGDVYTRLDRLEEAAALYEQASALDDQFADAFRGLGAAHLQAGDLQAAEAAYLQWISLRPDSAVAHTSLGLVYLKQADTEQARQTLTRAQELSDCSTNAALLLGGLYFDQGDYPQAEAAFRQALTIEPENADLHYLLGSSLIFQGRQSEAIQALEQAVSLDPDLVIAWRALGTANYEIGDYSSALEAYQQVADALPGEAFSYVSLGNAYEKLGQLDQAASAYQQALAIEDTADVRSFLGLVYATQGNFQQAAREYEQALELDPTSVLAYQALAEAHLQLGEYAAAEEALRSALEIEDNAQLQVQLALAYQLQGKVDAAVQALEAALASELSLPQAQLQLAGLYLQIGELTAAESLYQEVLAAEVNPPAAYYGLGQVGYKSCSMPDLAEAYQQAAQSAPDQALYAVLPALAAEIAGQIDQAAEAYADYASQFPQDPLAVILLAEYQLRQWEYSQAASLLEGVLEDSSGLTPVLQTIAWLDLGEVYLGAGDLDLAEAAYRTAIDILPSNASAAMRLGDLAILSGQPAEALLRYQEAETQLPAMALGISADSAALLEPQLFSHYSLALRRDGQDKAAEAAAGRALAAAERLQEMFPDWGPAAYAAGYVQLFSGGTPDELFARAQACDGSLERAVEMALQLYQDLQ